MTTTNRKEFRIPDLPSQSAMQSPATMTSLNSPISPGELKKGKSSTADRKGSTTSPRTPGPSPFDPYSPINKRPYPLSRTQTQATGSIFTPRVPTENQSPSREAVDETARTNALWAEMRATLAEVELSATRGTDQTHFFGTKHAKALEDLRNAQIGLAQAWARADGDGDGGEDVVGEPDGRNGSVGDDVSPGGSILNREGGRKSDERHRHRSSSAASTASISMDAASLAAENDIATAKLRREANDRYFYRVSKGVMDVVSKLEEVAAAMGRVEKESRSVWSDDEDSELDSRTERNSSADGRKKDVEKKAK